MCKKFTYLNDGVNPESGLSGDIITLDYADIVEVARLAYAYSRRAMSDNYHAIERAGGVPSDLSLSCLERTIADLRKAARVFGIVDADRDNLRVFSDKFVSITHLCHEERS